VRGRSCGLAGLATSTDHSTDWSRTPSCGGSRYLLARERRAWLVGLELPPAARTQVEVALRLIDQINVQLEPLDRELRALAARWPGTKALQAHSASAR
jgi:hypothetical protein